MKSGTELLLQHGWAFGSNCWQAWHDLATEEMVLHTPDRGYWREPQYCESFSATNSTKVLITHSLGLHLLSPACIEQTDLLVSIGGFARFHPEPAALHKRSEKIIERMKSNLMNNTNQCLQEFYTNCYSPSTGSNMPLPGARVEPLLGDLEILNQCQLDWQLLSRIPTILVLHGTDDAIVPKEKSIELHNGLTNSTLHLMPGAGHALPFTHVKWCWQQIMESLRNSQFRGSEDNQCGIKLSALTGGTEL